MLVTEKSYKNLLVECSDGVVVVKINRPKALNALNLETLDELEELLSLVEKDASCRVLILTGAGDRSFVAGADIRELKDLDESGGRDISLRGNALLRRLERSRLITIAAVNGFALGGGMELAMACDIRVAVEDALFGLPEVTLGIIPGFGGTLRLPRLIGRSLALELITTGRRFKADQALKIGLVNHVVPKEQLLDKAKEIAAEILQAAPLAVSAAKRSVMMGLDKSMDEAVEVEAEEFSRLCSSEDRNEGMQAFLEKRRPKFRGV